MGRNGKKDEKQRKQDDQFNKDVINVINSAAKVKSALLAEANGLEGLSLNVSDDSCDEDEVVESKKDTLGQRIPKDVSLLPKMEGLQELLSKNSNPILPHMIDSYRHKHLTATLVDVKELIETIKECDMLSGYQLVQYDDGDQTPLKGEKGQEVMAAFGKISS